MTEEQKNASQIKASSTAKPASKAKAAPKSKIEPKTKADPKSKTEPKVKATPKSKVEPKAKAAPKSKAEPKVKATPKTKAEPKKGKIESKAKAAPKTKAESKTPSKAKAVSKIKAEPTTTKVASGTKIVPKTKTVLKAIDKSKAEPRLKTRNKPGAPSGRELADIVAAAAAEHKPIDPVLLDLSGLSSVADWFFVTSASSPRQMTAIAEKIVRRAREHGVRPLGQEGFRKGGGAAAGNDHWVLVDLGDVVVHIFNLEAREMYDLEGLWTEAPRRPVKH